VFAVGDSVFAAISTRKRRCEDMKTALKNRPKEPCSYKTLEEWFEAFEKELRERLADLNKDDSRVYDIAKDHEALIIEEILGEA
jgi:hypothetical protein